MDLFDRDIPWKEHAKYLDHTIDKKLLKTEPTRRRDCHADQPLLAAKPQQLGEQRQQAIDLQDNTSANDDNGICYVTWDYPSATHIKCLHVIQSKVLRIVIDAPWFARTQELSDTSQGSRSSHARNYSLVIWEITMKRNHVLTKRPR